MAFPIENRLVVSGLFGFVVGMAVNRPVLGSATSTLMAISAIALDTLLGENFNRTALLHICALTVILQKAGRFQKVETPRERQRIKSVRTSTECIEN